MKRIVPFISAILIAASLFISLGNKSKEEIKSSSPTFVCQGNGFTLYRVHDSGRVIFIGVSSTGQISVSN